MASMLGISQGFYWQIEHKKRRLYYEMAVKIADFRILIFFTRKLYVGGIMFARLKELREFEGVTQEDEHKKRRLYYEMAVKIAAIFNLKPDDLFYET